MAEAFKSLQAVSHGFKQPKRTKKRLLLFPIIIITAGDKKSSSRWWPYLLDPALGDYSNTRLSVAHS
jgi:hypothetical protein